jgi:hypothetical protein
LADDLGLDPSSVLRDLEISVLRADPALDLNNGGAQPNASPPGPSPADIITTEAAVAQLPSGGGYFVGRARDVAALDALWTDKSTATVLVVTGPPGVGKTATAIHWARTHLDRFPDGQLYLDLRMQAGRLAKAGRGELAVPLPIGYVRRPNGEVVFDPDEQVQSVVRLVFRLFDELGTVNAVLRYLVDHQVQMGILLRSGLAKGDLVWRRPSRAGVQNMLRNPAVERRSV